MKLERSAAPNRSRRVDLQAWTMAGVLALMWATLAILPSTRAAFLSQASIATLLTQSSVLLIVSVGMTMAIIIRGIDLSVGAGLALTGVVAALFQIKLGMSVPVAISAAILTGAAIGLWHGVWVAWLGVPAFIVTLAGFKAFRGGALVLSHAQALTPRHEDFAVLAGNVPVVATWVLVLGVLAIGLAITLRDAQRRRHLGLEPITTGVVAIRVAGQVLLAGVMLGVFGATGMPVPVAVAAAVALGGVFITKRTRFGRHIYAIGGNPEAARFSGIDVKRVTLIVYVIVGVLTAIAGVLMVARVNGVTPGSQGEGLELDAVTAVVIGGASLAGGRGSVVGTVLGTLVVQTLARALNLFGIEGGWQLTCTGAALLVAALIDVLTKGRRS